LLLRNKWTLITVLQNTTWMTFWNDLFFGKFCWRGPQTSFLGWRFEWPRSSSGM